ncbi:MAG TPA: hypothetical protein VM032_07065 [Vicinamibacterales bacterium]|nr:hypothetical protein [Vicinamibacterales bacterium]
MKHGILAVTLVITLVSSLAPVSAQTRPANTSLGSVTLTHKVKADGQPLAAGTYQVRLGTDEPKPAVGQSPEGERYVEFLKGGKVVAREVATVVSDADVKSIAKGPQPARGGVRVDMLKGNDYVRVWINRGGNNYIIHLPPGA